MERGRVLFIPPGRDGLVAKDISGKGFVGSWSGDQFIKNNDKAMADAAREAAALFVREAKDIVSRPGPTTTHRAGESVGGETIGPSKPGEPPRRRIGVLRNSINFEKANESGTQMKAGVLGKLAPYAFWLEFGTKRGLKPRPFIRPTLAKLKGKFREIFIRHGKDGVNKS